ncbi:hypothetical protein K437DRAFT_173242 [Tilletiaria anomala UBC 951]|uniref:Uncharacterized protein n=1 Tax=Tilletiaria anomala (strain ATCC 24038 / CBS 436.72 / UBC 951) TaxID=1037660 RepID=A0A066WPN0_TILAU|nr:uncharacterized protein K437DRAFT_173242 [Tilletiaria anomala UBC 951]KDN52580.1 hypothetical protein K437DRAFT_173242 [Tilletiaria anomala UBC 951]
MPSANTLAGCAVSRTLTSSSPTSSTRMCSTSLSHSVSSPRHLRCDDVISVLDRARLQRSDAVHPRQEQRLAGKPHCVWNKGSIGHWATANTVQLRLLQVPGHPVALGLGQGLNHHGQLRSERRC